MSRCRPPLEISRPRHPHPETSQRGVRETAIAPSFLGRVLGCKLPPVVRARLEVHGYDEIEVSPKIVTMRTEQHRRTCYSRATDKTSFPQIGRLTVMQR